MTGPIAQIVALTIHGNAALKGRTIPRFFPDNSTCKYCDEVVFAATMTPDEWFANLLRMGAQSLRLIHEPENKPMISDRLSAGFVGGGGAWMIEDAIAGRRPVYWVAGWKVWDQHAPEHRIWRVTYTADQGEKKHAPRQDLGQVKQRFLTHLRAIRAFSHRETCDPFTSRFDRAIDTLSESTGALHGHYTDLSPAGFLETDAVRLLDAAQSAYVFGAMGSWNDLGFSGERQKEIERLSNDLFDTLTDVILSATNTSFPQPTH